MKPSQKGLIRIVRATANSMRGLKAAWQSEAAVRQDFLLCTVLLIIAILSPARGVELALLIGSLLILIIVELLNSAVEAAIDRIGPELHELSGKAKDIASAAVMFALINIIVTWVVLLGPWLWSFVTP